MVLRCSSGHKCFFTEIIFRYLEYRLNYLKSISISNEYVYSINDFSITFKYIFGTQIISVYLHIDRPDENTGRVSLIDDFELGASVFRRRI